MNKIEVEYLKYLWPMRHYVDAYADEDIEHRHRVVDYAAGGFPVNVYGTRWSAARP